MSATGKLSPPSEEAWMLMAKLFWKLRPRMIRVAQEFGLTPPQLVALRTLDPEHPVSMRELAEQLQCDSSNVTGLVDGLAARGLVERRESEHDRRVRMLVITERGAEVRMAMQEAVQTVPPAIAALSIEDQRLLRDILRRALDAEIQEMPAGPAPRSSAGAA